jgi:hypothetical protein
MAHGDARDRKWRGNWRMEWVACTLHTTSEHGVSSITTADAHTSAASSRMNWRPRRFKWTRPFRRKTKSGFCACAITFQLASTTGISFGSSRLFSVSFASLKRTPRYDFDQCTYWLISWWSVLCEWADSGQRWLTSVDGRRERWWRTSWVLTKRAQFSAASITAFAHLWKAESGSGAWYLSLCL